MVISTGFVLMALSLIGIIGFSIWLGILYRTGKKKKAEIQEEIQREYARTSHHSI